MERSGRIFPQRPLITLALLSNPHAVLAGGSEILLDWGRFRGFHPVKHQEHPDETGMNLQMRKGYRDPVLKKN